jgi:superfamily II DNA helicase RecQ
LAFTFSTIANTIVASCRRDLDVDTRCAQTARHFRAAESRARETSDLSVFPSSPDDGIVVFEEMLRKSWRRRIEEAQKIFEFQRTGWGKSLVYFIASKILREQGAGPTLLISPLLSLMRNQVEAAERIGIRAARLDSETRKEWDAIEARLAANDVDVLLVSPERLANQRFQTETIPLIAGGMGLVVVDEAHCISDWGHDFRPDYRRIVRIVQGLPGNVPVIATTATANDRVIDDVRAQLGDSLRVVRGPLARESLKLQTIRLADQSERLAWLADHLPRLPGSGIVYCLTTADCDRVAAWLRQKGIDAVAYHAQMNEEDETRGSTRCRPPLSSCRQRSTREAPGPVPSRTFAQGGSRCSFETVRMCPTEIAS